MSVIEAAPVTTPVEQRQQAWRLMGGAVALDGCKTVDDVLVRADLNWSVDKHPVHTRIDGVEHPVPGRFATVRSDNNLVLGDVGKSFSTFQNRPTVEFVHALCEGADVSYDGAVAGHMKSSQVVFASIEVPNGITVAGQDAVGSHILVSNGHNGSHALRASVIAFRIGCGNQVNSAFKNAAQSYAVRHVGEIDDKVEEVRRALTLCSTYMAEFEVIANRLADIDVDVEFFEDFVQELIPVDETAGNRTIAARQRQRAAIRQNWHATETLDPDLKATGWGALNVVTEVIDHGTLDVRKSKQDKGERRFLSSLEGPGAALRHRAFDLLSGEIDEPGRIQHAARERRLLTVG